MRNQMRDDWERSRELTCLPRMTTTRAAPAAVSPQVNRVPKSACQIGWHPSIMFGRLAEETLRRASIRRNWFAKSRVQSSTQSPLFVSYTIWTTGALPLPEFLQISTAALASRCQFLSLVQHRLVGPRRRTLAAPTAESVGGRERR